MLMTEQYEPKPAHFYRYGAPIEVEDHLREVEQRMGKTLVVERSHVAHFTSALNHDHYIVRKAAAVLLKKLENPTALPALRLAVNRETDDLAKRAMQTAIKHLQKKR